MADKQGSSAAIPAVSVIVVSYNTREMTVACLKSVIAETRRASYELIVIDNASTDGSSEAIACKVPQARLIRSAANLGFAAANNEAAKQARGEFVLLLNPDTLVLDDAISRLIEFASERPDAGIWGGKTLFADHSLNRSSCFRRLSPWNLFCRATGLSSAFRSNNWLNSEFYGNWDHGNVREVDVVTGCFFLMRRAFWSRLGGFDARFFMYGEEADLCLRARRLGARPIVTPQATIIHYGGGSEPLRAEKNIRVLRAKVTLMRRYWSRPIRPLGELLFRLDPLLRIAVLSLANGVLPGRSKTAQVEAWRQIWTRRNEWLTDFDTLPGPAPAPLQAAIGQPTRK